MSTLSRNATASSPTAIACSLRNDPSGLSCLGRAAVPSGFSLRRLCCYKHLFGSDFLRILILASPPFCIHQHRSIDSLAWARVFLPDPGQLFRRTGYLVGCEADADSAFRQLCSCLTARL